MDRESDRSKSMRVGAEWEPLLVAAPVARPRVPALLRCYAQPHRAYHGISHIAALASLFDEVAAGPGWCRPEDTAIAILYHDAIYEPTRSDNEARSAQLARTELHGADVDIERIAALIDATATHGGQGDAISDDDLAHFLDADMSILGAAPDTYDAYVRGVRSEYAAVPAEAFSAGRRAFLEGLLARPQIFLSPFFVRGYEAQARANIARELAEAARTRR